MSFRSACASGLVVLLAAAATGSAATSARFDRDGISFAYPASWYVTTQPLSNGINPRYVFTVSTEPVQRTPKDLGPCLPGIASQLPKDAVLAYVREALGTDRRTSLPRMQPRPRTFRLPSRSDNALCGFARGGTWLPFKSQGRAFYLGVYIGPQAARASVDALRRTLNGMRIDPR